MNIDLPSLKAQVNHALQEWPVILEVERSFSLPPYLLFAVGSRETNLTNEVGDGGHGHGVWQLDDRSNTIPPGFDADVRAQATKAASTLHGLLVSLGSVVDAADAYNAGWGGEKAGAEHGNPDLYTTGGDYGTDVHERLVAILAFAGVPHHVVSRGESLQSIATRYGLTTQGLRNLNPTFKFNTPLKIGVVLVV